MSFAGRLQEFPLAELLQVLATSGESGKLRLTRSERDGVIVFRNGKIVYAASSSARQTLGNLLLLERLITEEQLTKALELQHQDEREKRLGVLLLEVGAIDEETLTRVVRDQTERVISEFMHWPDGYFKLDRMQVSDLGEVEVDAEDFLMREGLSTDKVLSELTSKLEELQRHDLEAGAAAELPAAAEGRDLASLKSIMGEIRSPEFTGEITQRILSFAQDLFERGVLFVVRQDGFGLMGQFGLDLPDAKSEAGLRQLHIANDQPSILLEAIERKEAVRGPLEDTACNRRILEVLGGAAPGEALAAPLIVNGQVLLVLYCDHLVEAPRAGWLAEIELLLLQAGLAMEKDLLAKRIEHYNSLRRHR